MLSSYHRPTDLEQLFNLLEATPGACVIAGGTDLLCKLRDGRMAEPPALISLRSVAGLKGIEFGRRVRLGAATTLTELLEEPRLETIFPALTAAVRAIGSTQIRSVATLAGNLVNASPCADTAPPLLVYEACLEIRCSNSSREVALDDFFTGPKETCLRGGEIVTAILLEPPPDGSHALFQRASRVGMDLAQANLALLLAHKDSRCQRVRVAVGAVAPTPRRLRQTEFLLEGQMLDPHRIGQAARAAREEIEPINDQRASAAFRAQVIGVFVKRALKSIARGETP